MPITRYSIDDIHKRMLNQMVNHSGENHIRLDAHPLNLLAMASAGAIASLYDALDDAVKNSFVTTATGANLDRLGFLWNIKRGAPTFAKCNITISGAQDATIPANSLLSNANGLLYQTDEEIKIIATEATDAANAADTNNTQDAVSTQSTVSVSVTATEAGDAYNLDADDELAWQIPIAHVDSFGIVQADNISKAVNAEGDSQFRQRILLELRNPRKLGTENDYKSWGLMRGQHGVPVSKAFVRGGIKAGEVEIFILVEKKGDFLATPSAAQIQAVKTYIDTQRPVGTKINVKAASIENIDIEISDLKIDENSNKEEVETQIKYQLSALFLRGAGLSHSFGINLLYEAISNVQAVKSFKLTKPTDNLTPQNNNSILKPKITF
ncbi:MAG: baseplate J/gp47 family protein [Alphaproteobacteria bacterium]|nr:baseplate J/gp47 family protein [Alphaproteobacteria bacterium]